MAERMSEQHIAPPDILKNALPLIEGDLNRTNNSTNRYYSLHNQLTLFEAPSMRELSAAG